MSQFRCVCLYCLLLLTFVFTCGYAFGQSDPDEISQVLGEEILAPSAALHQIKSFILSRVAPPPSATSAQQWTEQARRLRQHLLQEVVFHGWPDEWGNSPPKFEDIGVIETGQGYRLRKLRYEIVPGFQSVAILYEPERLQGKLPAILNVNGHVGPLGKAVEYKQKRCINFAKHGILALNLEWFFFGELRQEGNQHWYGAHLDLVGANALGIFLLEMRRGLDYLYNHPSVDRNRVGVTGLSSGGWQTILLIYDAEDDCCFRAPLVKPLVYDSVKPFFKLYGREDVFPWYQIRDPGTHNYQLNNREHAYRFFSAQFGLPPIEKEVPVGQEIKRYDELVVGLPKDNLTILGLARKLGNEITRRPVPLDSTSKSGWANEEREKLRSVVRYKPVQLTRVWTVANTKHRGIETLSY